MVQFEKIANMQNAVSIRLHGELASFNGNCLHGIIERLVDAGMTYVVIDCADISLGTYREVLFLDSAKRLRETDGLMVVVLPPIDLIECWKKDNNLLLEMLKVLVVAQSRESAFAIVGKASAKASSKDTKKPESYGRIPGGKLLSGKGRIGIPDGSEGIIETRERWKKRGWIRQ